MNKSIAKKYIPIAHNLVSHLDRANQHASLIFIGQQLVAAGINERKTHPLSIKYGYLYPDMHSELAAWVKCKHLAYQNDLTLVNYHFNKRGVLKLSRPCSRCLPWVTQIFSDIWYSTPDGFMRLIY